MSTPYTNGPGAAKRQLEIAAAAIANSRGGRRGVPEVINILELLPDRLRAEVLEDAEAALEAVHLPQLCIALEDAVRIIRLWHSMGLDKATEEATWKTYREDAPEMQPIMLALETMRRSR